MKLLYSLLISFILILNQISHINAYGESINGYPNSNERETVVLINMVRMFPYDFKNDYLLPLNQTGIGKIFTIYTPTGPVRSDHSLTVLSRAHSIDMGDNGCFSHDSCNREDIWDRFKRFKACGGGNGENISAGNSNPLGSMAAFLCDSKDGSCVVDGEDGDGHRKNIMNPDYESVGAGYYYVNKGYRHYYTQDFAGSICDDTENSPIYSAYYTMVGNVPRFVAVYYNNSNPLQSVSLVYNSTSYEMNLKYGNKSRAVLTKDNVKTEFCNPFYFEALASNGTLIRYPTEGFLRIATNSSCPSWSDSFEYSSASTLTLSITILISITLLLLFI